MSCINMTKKKKKEKERKEIAMKMILKARLSLVFQFRIKRNTQSMVLWLAVIIQKLFIVSVGC